MPLFITTLITKNEYWDKNNQNASNFKNLITLRLKKFYIHFNVFFLISRKTHNLLPRISSAHAACSV